MLSAAQPGVETPFAGAARRHEKKNEAEQHGGLSLIDDGPCAVGRVELGEGAAGVGGVPVVLRHIGSGATVRVTTFGDGSFYATGLRPGQYEAAVTRETLDLLKATQSAARFEVTAAQSGPVEGVVVRLIRATATPLERASD